MEQLLAILSLRREHKSAGELIMINQHIMPLKPELYKSMQGEVAAFVVTVPSPVPTPNNILWSCHIDTMHHGRDVVTTQEVWQGDDGVWFVTDKDDCLGADDGAGVWLLMQMIQAKVPGTYIFHRGEERGGIGSKVMATEHTDFISTHTHAIAFDRRGTTSVITHQGGERGASDTFASFLIETLGMGHELDTTGSYTDTKEYFRLVPECLNFSIGYDSEHGSRETLDTTYLFALRDTMCGLDWTQVVFPVSRDKDAVEYDDWGSVYAGSNWRSWTPKHRKIDVNKIPTDDIPTVDQLRNASSMDVREWVYAADPADVAWAIDDLIGYMTELEDMLGLGMVQ
jgi:hypothetical protein